MVVLFTFFLLQERRLNSIHPSAPNGLFMYRVQVGGNICAGCALRHLPSFCSLPLRLSRWRAPAKYIKITWVCKKTSMNRCFLAGAHRYLAPPPPPPPPLLIRLALLPAYFSARRRTGRPTWAAFRWRNFRTSTPRRKFCRPSRLRETQKKWP